MVTITAAVPAEAMAAAGMAAVSCVELTNVVTGAVTPKLIVEAATKLVPLIVSVKPAALPATALVGEIAVIVGTGLPPAPVDAVPPPHPARNSRITIPEVTSPLNSTHWCFMTPFRPTDLELGRALHVPIVPISVKAPVAGSILNIDTSSELKFVT